MNRKKFTILYFADSSRHQGVIEKYRSLSNSLAESGLSVSPKLFPFNILGIISFLSAVLKGGKFIYVRCSVLFFIIFPAILLMRVLGSRILVELPAPVPRFLISGSGVIRSSLRLVKTFFLGVSHLLGLLVAHRVFGFVSNDPLVNFFRLFKKKYVLIANWSDFSSFSLAEKSRTTTTLEMVFVANISIQHGVDRVISGMKTYKNSRLAIVGEGSEKENLEKLVAQNNLSGRVSFHGACTGKKLDAIFEGKHVGLTVFGFHRVGVFDGSPLKTREYAARGLPSVGSYNDTGIPAGISIPFLCLEAGESPVDVRRIHEFCLKHQDRGQVKQAFAEFFDVRVAVQRILKFMH